MSAEPSYQVPLSQPTYHALHLVARIDEIAVEQIVETLMATYLETRLRAIHQAENNSPGVIDLASWKEERGATSGASRRRPKSMRRRSASPR
jgi:hypothetical protein